MLFSIVKVQQYDLICRLRFDSGTPRAEQLRFRAPMSRDMGNEHYLCTKVGDRQQMVKVSS
jgi:hypothetical protein